MDKNLNEEKKKGGNMGVRVKINNPKFISSLDIYDRIRKTISRFSEDMRDLVKEQGKDVNVHVTLEFIE